MVTDTTFKRKRIQPYVWEDRVGDTAFKALISMNIKRLVSVDRYSFEDLVEMTSEDMNLPPEEVEYNLRRYNSTGDLGVFTPGSNDIRYCNDKTFLPVNLESPGLVKRVVLSLS